MLLTALMPHSYDLINILSHKCCMKRKVQSVSKKVVYLSPYRRKSFSRQFITPMSMKSSKTHEGL